MRFDINKVFIIGDSYTTFRGYNPLGYPTYYDSSYSRGLDVRRVEETWWHKLLTAVGAELVRNDSWSGSTVCYTTYSGFDCSQSSSFIYRVRKLAESGFFRDNEIDTVIISGGTNDSWAGAPLGEPTFSDFSEESLYSARPAISYLVMLLRELLPEANIFYIINTNMKPEITAAIKEACRHFSAEYVELKKVDKVNGHPTVKGMDDIYREFMELLS